MISRWAPSCLQGCWSQAGSRHFYAASAFIAVIGSLPYCAGLPLEWLNMLKPLHRKSVGTRQSNAKLSKTALSGWVEDSAMEERDRKDGSLSKQVGGHLGVKVRILKKLGWKFLNFSPTIF